MTTASSERTPPRGNRFQSLTFFVVFAVLCVAELLALQLPITEAPMWKVKVIISKLTGSGMTALGCPASVDGSHINFGAQSIDIIDECTGIYATILLTSFIIAFPQTLNRKLKGLAIALVFVFVVNVLRLIALGLLLDVSPETAKFAHDYLWQVIWGAALVGYVVVFARDKPGRGVDAVHTP